MMYWHITKSKECWRANQPRLWPQVATNS